ncbi:hypothetical protein IV203_028050 [Nitzschia inconspicua]|uniref:Uncharacterized protein n=1 Tax=Nitzschia inconspicua TaxID=303405 RepID=A0A9K3Q6M8_9STRA|nr:hypothetical protein IV203_028050 [Nitzschia inconspicua]
MGFRPTLTQKEEWFPTSVNVLDSEPTTSASIQVIDTNEEPGVGTPPEDSILDLSQRCFRAEVFKPDLVFETVEDLMVAINEYQELFGNIVAIRRMRGNARTFTCFSHVNCLFNVKFRQNPRQEEQVHWKCLRPASRRTVSATNDFVPLSLSDNEVAAYRQDQRHPCDGCTNLWTFDCHNTSLSSPFALVHRGGGCIIRDAVDDVSVLLCDRPVFSHLSSLCRLSLPSTESASDSDSSESDSVEISAAWVGGNALSDLPREMWERVRPFRLLSL